MQGSGPGSKGKFEAVVKYLKYNFAKNCTFADICQFNSQCLDWLSRTGNGKEHQTTKKVPAQMSALEKQHLIPVPAYETTVPESIVTYQVRKDNTILYHSNRYQVPFGTYRPGLRARLLEQDGKVSMSLFFHLISGLHEQSAIILTSNKGFEDWPELFGDTEMVTALEGVYARSWA